MEIAAREIGQEVHRRGMQRHHAAVFGVIIIEKQQRPGKLIEIVKPYTDPLTAVRQISEAHFGLDRRIGDQTDRHIAAARIEFEAGDLFVGIIRRQVIVQFTHKHVVAVLSAECRSKIPDAGTAGMLEHDGNRTVGIEPGLLYFRDCQLLRTERQQER